MEDLLRTPHCNGAAHLETNLRNTKGEGTSRQCSTTLYYHNLNTPHSRKPPRHMVRQSNNKIHYYITTTTTSQPHNVGKNVLIRSNIKKKNYIIGEKNCKAIIFP